MRLRLLLSLILVLVCLCMPLGCGGGGGSQPVGVSVNPSPATLAVGGKQVFAATVTNTSNTAVTWSVQEGASGGTVTSSGEYTAPNTAGTYHVVAVSQTDPSKSATVTITVHLVVSVNPTTATLTLGQSQPFAATIVGSADMAVTWSVQEGASGGSVSATGGYKAPNQPGTYHVVATSHADPSQSAQASVVVQAGSASGTIQ